MNLWYEARLTEEGIESAEELLTANIVDVLLHTRVPVARLVDWLDQAHLLLCLLRQAEQHEHAQTSLPTHHRTAPNRRPTGQGHSSNQHGQPLDQQRVEPLRPVLRRAGIRTATDLLAAFGVYRPVQGWAEEMACHENTTLVATRHKQLQSPDPDKLSHDGWRASLARRTR